MLFYVFNLLLQNYIFTFDIVRQQIVNLPLLSKSKTVLSAVQRGLQEVVEVFSFLFSCKGDDKGASFIIFFLTT